MNTKTVLDDLGPRSGDGQPNETKQHGVCMHRWREVTCPSHLGQQEPLQWRCIFSPSFICLTRRYRSATAKLPSDDGNSDTTLRWLFLW